MHQSYHVNGPLYEWDKMQMTVQKMAAVQLTTMLCKLKFAVKAAAICLICCLS